MTSLLVSDSAILEDTGETVLAEFFGNVRELLIEISAHNNLDFSVLLDHVRYDLQHSLRLVPHQFRLSRFQVTIQDV